MAGGADVAAVGQGEERELHAGEQGHEVQGVLAGAGQAVHGDDPGAADAGDEPGRQGAEFAGDLDVGVVEAEGRAGVADVEVRGEPRLVAGPQGAVGDGFQAAYDGVGGVRGGGQDRADDRVGAVAGESVAAGPQGGQVPGEGDLPAAVPCTVRRGSVGRGRPGAP